MTLPAELYEALVRTGFVRAGDDVDAEALTGGVSSDIWRVATGTTQVCLKRALPVLRTSARWEAPVERSAAEAAWLDLARAVAPGAVPDLLAVDAPTGTLVLEYLPPERYTVWKHDLLRGDVSITTAATVGTLLRRLHEAAADTELRSRFDHRDLIEALRLEPYLARTAGRRPAVAAPFERLAREFHEQAGTVVHGDVSPKNILVDGDRVVLLDAECATWGDPAFDVAFCLTHLGAKAAHLPRASGDLRRAATALADGYGPVSTAVSERCGRWLGALLLARVDGASPLEYLDDDSRSRVRRAALDLVARPPDGLAATLDRWFGLLHRDEMDDDGT